MDSELTNYSEMRYPLNALLFLLYGHLVIQQQHKLHGSTTGLRRTSESMAIGEMPSGVQDHVGKINYKITQVSSRDVVFVKDDRQQGVVLKLSTRGCSGSRSGHLVKFTGSESRPVRSSQIKFSISINDYQLKDKHTKT